MGRPIRTLYRSWVAALWLGTLLLLGACYPEPYERSNPADPGGNNFQVVDEDEDGFDADSDCDDQNALINPDASESCNGVDDNCDSNIDEGLDTTPYYTDADGDGYGDEEMGPTSHCGDPDPTKDEVVSGGDCDDSDDDVHPGATEVCNEIDDNCEDGIDEGLLTTYYFDNDQDGYGDLASEACEQNEGFSTQSGDCDDNESDIYPGATEICDGLDNNCDEEIDEGLEQNAYYYDSDQDNYGDESLTIEACIAPEYYVALGGDCDDSNAAINPAESELCDDIDNNCNDEIDENLPIASYYLDNDNDDYGTPSVTLSDCVLPDGYSTRSGDCDDNVSEVNPSAEEICDGIDNNCDQQVDEGFEFNTYYRDADSDTYGDPNLSAELCEVSGEFVAQAGDCDDSNAAINPDAEEVCDGVDNNCDEQIDEGLETLYYLDGDGDGFGLESDTVLACTAPEGYVIEKEEGFDCDDADNTSYPGADRVCDGSDHDCDGVKDDPVDFYIDADLDGYGTIDDIVQGCNPPEGYAYENTDCDDDNGDINPGADELCDGVDNNCNAEVDEGLELLVSYQDSDGDDYGVDSASVEKCEIPEGYTENSGDCDDENAEVYPGADEPCDGTDWNCDGEAATEQEYYLDADQDQYGDLTQTQKACFAPDGYTSDNTDCDDTDAEINPAATEICDEVDNDCNGTIDDAEEGLTTFYLDSDGDTYGVGSDTTAACSLPEGYASLDGDCDDSDASISPDAIELFDSTDNDCDDLVDEDVPLPEAATSLVDGTLDSACGGANVANTLGYGRSILVGELDGLAGDELLVQVGSSSTGGFCYWKGSELVEGSANAAFLTGHPFPVMSGAIGDIDGDHVEDVVLSAQSEAGSSLYVFIGGGREGFSGVYEAIDADYSLTETSLIDLGLSLITLDINRDGSDEILAGSPTAGSGVGGIYVAALQDFGDSDPSLGYQYLVEGSESGGGLGTALVVEQGSNTAEFWASAPMAMSGKGVVYLLDGEAVASAGTEVVGLKSVTVRTLLSDNSEVTGAGVALTSLGDSTGDGFSDLLVMADTTDSTGVVYLVPGIDWSGDNSQYLDEIASPFWGEAGVRTIRNMASLGDLNGDSLIDFGISTTTTLDDSSLAEVYLILGQYGGLYEKSTLPDVALANVLGPDVAASDDVAIGYLEQGGGQDNLLTIGCSSYSSDGFTQAGLLATVISPY